MSRARPQFAKRALPRELQPLLNRLVETRGADRASAILGVSRPVVDALLYGGSAIPTSVARVREALLQDVLRQ